MLYLSLDPYMRGRMSDAKSYAAPVPIDGIIEGETVCEVIKSRHTGFAPGDIVRGRTGWCTYAVMRGIASGLLNARRADLYSGRCTRHAGLHSVERAKVHRAAQARGDRRRYRCIRPVGSMVGQLAKMAGARAVGIAGGDEKCAFAKDELDFDAVVNHRSPDLVSDLKLASPNGIDVLRECRRARVGRSAARSKSVFAYPGLRPRRSIQWGDASGSDRLPVTMSTILRRSLRVRGFIQTEFAADHYDSFLSEVGPKVASGQVKHREDVVDGLENAPEAFIGMLTGKTLAS